MFNRNKDRSALILPNVKKMSDTELYGQFLEEVWTRYGIKDRLRLLQEVENRRAKIDGRPTIPVMGAPNDPTSLGMYVEGKMLGMPIKMIFINALFLEESNGKLDFHTGINALETILHEGRHANQHYIMDHRPDRIAAQVLHEWLASTTRYFPSEEPLKGDLKEKEFIFYLLQSIETDARRFARRQLIQIHDQLAAQGKDTRRIAAVIQDCRQQEIEMINCVREHLTMDDIRKAELIVCNAMKISHPQIDAASLKLFENARIILRLPKPKTNLDYDVIIERLDHIADARMKGLPDGQIARIAEGRDRIQDGWRHFDRI